MQRNKSDGRECDMGTRVVPLSEGIHTVVSADLQWGGKVTDNGDNIVVKTLVFGDVDITIIKGDDVEMNIMRKVIEVFKEERTNGVINFLITIMGYKPDPTLKYSFEDACLVYGMFLDGERDPGMIDLIVNRKIEISGVRKPITQEKIDEVIDLKKKLDLKPEDGVNGLIASHMLGVM